MPVALGEEVIERDGERKFVWLVVSEVVPMVNAEDGKPANVTRNVECWCASGVLAPYTHKASREQILTLVYAGRIQGLPQKKKGVYLIYRNGLARIYDRPKQDKERPREGKQTGAGAPEGVN